jgi:hypothetical protein
MNRRCYNKNYPQYKNYGEKGVTICDRWRILDNFIEDIDKIKGFDIDDFLNGKLALDKDIKDREGKIYSLEKCCFTSLKENNKVKINQQKPFIAISPSGEIIKCFNQSELAREYNLLSTHICACLNGRQKSTKGWKFKYEL